MAIKNRVKKIKKSSFFIQGGLAVFLLLLVVNGVVFYTVNLFVRGQTACMTQQQIDADSRCLYIISGKIYSKGSRTSPHNGHQCGTDVTSVVPASHTGNSATYLVPNYIADVCIAVPTSEPSPTTQPSATSVPSATSAPSATTAPSATSAPTSPVSTTAPSATNAPSATAAPTSAVPSPGCLGGCVTPNATQPQVLITQGGGGNPGGGNNQGGFLQLIMKLIKIILQMLQSLLGGGRGQGGGRGHGDGDD